MTEMIDVASEAFCIEDRQVNKMLESMCEAKGIGLNNMKSLKFVHPNSEKFQHSENRLNFLIRICQSHIKSIINSYTSNQVMDVNSFEHGEKDLKIRQNAEIKFYKSILNQLESGVRYTFFKKASTNQPKASLSMGPRAPCAAC